MGEVIRARLAARPFVPFRLVLTGGHSSEVLEPDLAVVEGDAVVKLFRRVPGELDWGGTLSLPHVVSVEDADDGPTVVTAGS